MALETSFKPIELDQLHREAALLKVDGWRFIQTHAVNTDDGVDLYYSFMKDGSIVNYRVAGVKKDQQVPSITDLFLAAFVFENEARELFGVDMRDIAIDFAGAMYTLAESEPMTFLSPEQKAARDKARAAAAKEEAAPAAAKEEGAPAAEKAPADAPAKGGFVMTPERQARLDAKMATMSPEKRAKVEAALKARAAKAADGSASTAAPAPEKQSAADQPSAASSDTATQPSANAAADAQVEKLLGLMDGSKADVVRKALNMKGGE